MWILAHVKKKAHPGSGPRSHNKYRDSDIIFPVTDARSTIARSNSLVRPNGTAPLCTIGLIASRMT